MGKRPILSIPCKGTNTKMNGNSSSPLLPNSRSGSVMFNCAANSVRLLRKERSPPFLLTNNYSDNQ